MRLRQYLTTAELTPQDFAQRAGVTIQAVYRYMTGERMPHPDMILRIKELTDGNVLANDFADSVAEWRSRQPQRSAAPSPSDPEPARAA